MSGYGWLKVIADVFGRMNLDGVRWFWLLADGFGWIQVFFSDLQF